MEAFAGQSSVPEPSYAHLFRCIPRPMDDADWPLCAQAGLIPLIPMIPALALLFLAASPQDVTLPETLVEAPRSEFSQTHSASQRTVIEGDALRATGERSLPKAISRAGGVWTQETNLGGGAPFIRGLTGNQVLLIVDGLRINDSTTRFGPNPSLNTIDPATVERVEILRGPASVLYGSDAIGGVVLIWTRRATPGSGEGVAGEVGLSHDSAASGGRLSAAGSFVDESWGWFGVGSLEDWGTLTAGDSEDQEFTGYDGHSLFQSLEHNLSRERNLRFTARMTRQNDVPRTDKMVAGFGQSSPNNELYNFARQQREGYGLTYSDDNSSPLADRVQVRLAAHRYREDREKQKTGDNTFTFEQDDVETLSLGVDVKKLLGANHLVTWGLDLSRDSVDSLRVDTDTTTGIETDKDGSFAPGSEYTSGGVFLQDDVLGGLPFDLTAGVRYSWYDFSAQPTGGAVSGSFDALTASLRAGRDISAGVRLSASLAQGFRAPNLDDLVHDGDFGGGDELANPDLDPEQSLTAEIGLDVRGEESSWSLAIHDTDIQDVIGRVLTDEGDPAVAGDETYLRNNTGDVRLWGLEGAWRRQLSDGPWAVSASAAHVLGRQHDDTVDISSGSAPYDGVDWRRVPPLYGSLGLSWSNPDTASRLANADLELVWADRQDRLHPQDESDPRIDPTGTPGWARLDLDIGGPLAAADGSGASWSVGVHNILDKNYRIHGSGFDAPGRSLVVSLNLMR